MKIESISLTSLQREELFGLGKNIEAILPMLANAIEVKAAVGSYKTALDAFDAVLKPASKSNLTDDVVAADEVRDNLLTGLRLFLQSTLYDLSLSPAEHETAQKLNIIYDTYGNAQKLSYQKESGVIHNLLADLQAVPDYDQLGAKRWTDQIANAQRQFDTLYQTRMTEIGDTKLPLGETKRCADLFIEQYRQLMTLVEALSAIKPADYEPFIKAANAAIIKAKAALKLRATLAKKKPEEAEA
ncbi:MAG: DUF6261 family protein [Paludibacteraceae bacterium]|nr:DUF6261 family protein [Paludibacteraceae bacterium]